jgi:hypothetical protein
MGWIVQGLNHGRGKWFFSSPNHPDWLWSLPSFLFNWYQCFFLEVKHRDMMLITHLYLMMRLRMTGVLPLLPPHAFMAWTITTLPCHVTNTVHHQTEPCFVWWCTVFVTLYGKVVIVHATRAYGRSRGKTPVVFNLIIR